MGQGLAIFEALRGGLGQQAEDHAHDALTVAVRLRAHLLVPNILECLGELAINANSHREAVRLFGAADAARQEMGAARFEVHQTDYDAGIALLRTALNDKDFDAT